MRELGHGAAGIFDLSRRYAGLDGKNDPLVALAVMVPWASFRAELRAALVTGGCAPRPRLARARRDASLGTTC